MAETITSTELRDEFDALIRLATKILNEHTDNHGLCAVCGCAFPCKRAVLAEHNLAF
ncbi:MAG TPA: hypothetical protein VGZ32_08620 [Actinocrinis sp.]|jgi:hypothetical protein|uniref:hypothetical protein n=1 Tax=Actinocrinis sp. TaxID=1920516 RepID=UPI002DDD0D69|nr:hypothetical protein [Actinocrinis sp.]HEV3170388.1 hypothetical protein [Actinocrinis sp.]